MNSSQDDPELPGPGFPIRRSSDQRLLSGSPRLIAAGYVLLRRLAPRHPPCALSSLTIIGKIQSLAGLRTVPSELPRACATFIQSWSRVRSSRTRDAGYPYAIVKDLRYGSDVPRTRFSKSPPFLTRRLLDERAHDRFKISSSMELMGIEPTTSGLQNRRSPS
jgi:hypothetical protein